MLLKNLANLGCNAAHLTLMKAAQMERANEMVNLINGNVALVSQSKINILTKILKPGNQAIDRKCIRYGEFDF